ncbi:ribosome biogenesis protein Nop16 [Dimargaris cristalligena]|uniref:Nucleolar protein 16 n=1 Tax=Dimargaris cristalligena TaxID=215637 RepID=A0A4Q0A116_9FUNG|nr:ribosome biogenesis protein Nop16 [Dimargaris cristalligena]|eukprot:RKP38820.1 ribosome biogenesis protein Nop16 [Dimargaris cristalligena]
MSRTARARSSAKRKTGRRKADVRLTKSSAKKVEVKGFNIIRENWNPRMTVRQNYRELGLVAQLNGPDQNPPKKVKDLELVGPTPPGHHHRSRPELERLQALCPTGYGIIERDAEGNVINVILPKQAHWEDYKPPPVAPKTAVVAELERKALLGNAPRPAKLSGKEERFLQGLIDKHGENYRAMALDSRLNKLQESAGALKRRIRKYLDFTQANSA